MAIDVNNLGLTIHQHSTCRAKNLLHKDKRKKNHFLGIIINLFKGFYKFL